MDAIDAKSKIVRELKPDTPSGLARGAKQLKRYIEALKKHPDPEIRGDYTGYLNTYRKWFMTKAELITMFRGLARPLGYKNKAGLFWKTGSELTMLIFLQKSACGDGVYVNVGLTTNAMVIKAVPPSVAYWSRMERVEGLESPFLATFERLIMKSDLVTAEEAAEALRWLLNWMEDRYGDEEAVRKAELCAYPNEWGILIDWAKGNAKPPSFYFPKAAYYRAPKA